MNAREVRKSALKSKAHDGTRLVDVVRQRRWEAGERAELSELVGRAPAYGRPSVVGLVPTRGNTRVVDRARLTRERVPRYRQRLHRVGRAGAGS